jgi:hypothetical protein
MHPADVLLNPIAGVPWFFAVTGYHVAGRVSIKAAGSEIGWSSDILTP